MRRTTVCVVLLSFSLLAGAVAHAGGLQGIARFGATDQLSSGASETDDPFAAKAGEDQTKTDHPSDPENKVASPKCIVPGPDLLGKMEYRNWDPLGLVGKPTEDARLVRVNVRDVDAMSGSFAQTGEVDMHMITSIEVECRDGTIRTFSRPANTDFKYVKAFLNNKLQKLSKNRVPEVPRKKESVKAPAKKEAVKKREPANDETQNEGKVVLEKKRQQHTAWSVREVGWTAVTRDSPDVVLRRDYSGTYGYVTHNYYQTPKSYYGREAIQGQLVSYEGNLVTLAHVHRFNPATNKWVDVGTVQVKDGNLGGADRTFLDGYRALEKKYAPK